MRKIFIHRALIKYEVVLGATGNNWEVPATVPRSTDAMYDVFHAYLIILPLFVVGAMMRQHQTSLMLKFHMTHSPPSRFGMICEPIIGTSECAHVHLFTVTRMENYFIKTDFPQSGGLGPQWNDSIR